MIKGRMPQCAHAEAGQCLRCANPRRYIPTPRTTMKAARLRAHGEEPHLTPKTPPMLKAFMRSNHAERVKSHVRTFGRDGARLCHMKYAANV